MKFMDSVRGAAVRLLFPVFRSWMVHIPDWAQSRIFRALAWLAYLITGDKMARQALLDLVDIFKSGPPFSATLRKLIGGSEPEVVASIFKCMRRPGPYEK